MQELEQCLCKITFGVLTKALRGRVTLAGPLQKEQLDTCCWKTLNQAETLYAYAEMFPQNASAITYNMQKAYYQHFSWQMYPENVFVLNGKCFQTERKHTYLFCFRTQRLRSFLGFFCFFLKSSERNKGKLLEFQNLALTG